MMALQCSPTLLSFWVLGNADDDYSTRHGTHGPGYDTGPFSPSFNFGATVGDRINNGTRPLIFEALKIVHYSLEKV
ncbi:hypothetical protein BJV78DRAFT_1265306 [Lactifluus subvellereus]|nr:hypothetical protein BJV78DRAFT_1265306 [Lactifluus subvellereus]